MFREVWLIVPFVITPHRRGFRDTSSPANAAGGRSGTLSGCVGIEVYSVQCWGFRDWGLGSRVQGLEFEDCGLGIIGFFRDQGIHLGLGIGGPCPWGTWVHAGVLLECLGKFLSGLNHASLK